MRIRNKKKIALVLSGGGIKAAAFHAGVCLALKEKGFRFSGGTRDHVKKYFSDDDPMTIRLYVGSSGGSFVSSILASGYPVESLINAFQAGAGGNKTFDDFAFNELRPLKYSNILSVNTKGILRSIPNFFNRRGVVLSGWESMLKHLFSINGFFTTNGIEAYLRKNVLPTNNFGDLGVELFIIGTQLNHSRKVIFGGMSETSKNEHVMFANFAKISEAVAASSALPPVFAPVGIKRQDGKELHFFDGEIRDTLSTHVAADYGADLVISSYSVQPYHYTPEFGSLHTYGIPMIVNQALYQVIEQKIRRHIQRQGEMRGISSAIDGYLREIDVTPEHRQKIQEILEKRLGFRSEVDYIYIHPKPQNHEMFFVDHFSLNPKVMERIVRIGFKSAINTLRQHGI